MTDDELEAKAAATRAEYHEDEADEQHADLRQRHAVQPRGDQMAHGAITNEPSNGKLAGQMGGL